MDEFEDRICLHEPFDIDLVYYQGGDFFGHEPCDSAQDFLGIRVIVAKSADFSNRLVKNLISDQHIIGKFFGNRDLLSFFQANYQRFIEGKPIDHPDPGPNANIHLLEIL